VRKPTTLTAVVTLAFASSGCLTEWGRELSTGAVYGLTTPEATQRIGALASSASTAAGESVREEILGKKTDLAATRLIQTAGNSVDAELASLTPQIRSMVRLSIDEALGKETQAEITALREQILGAPARADVNALLDSASPHVAQVLKDAVSGAVAPVEVDIHQANAEASTEAAKWRPIAMAFALGCGLLLVAIVLAVILIRSHQKTLAALVAPC
jgi:hypothetical protein